jgi:hypothetical protein
VLFMKALDAATDEIPTPEIPAGTSAVNVTSDSNSPETDKRPSRAARRADAFAIVAESFIKNGGGALSGRERHQIVVHIDADTLRDSTAGRCELEHGPALPAETARRLSCDSSVIPLIENERGEPLNVGRRTRSIPPAIRHALNARDRGCRFPGCTHTRYADAHHVQHWALGGETKSTNLVLLCRHHHRLVHEGGITVQALDDGAFRFVRPNGRAFDSSAPGSASDWTQLLLQHRDSDIHIGPDTAATRCRGERMDYGLAVEVLLLKSLRARGGGRIAASAALDVCA